MPLRIVGAAIVGLIVGQSLNWQWDTTQPVEMNEIVDPANGVHRLVIRADSANQCYIEATVTGGRKPVRLRFLMDTGAAGYVSLTQQAARALGFDTPRLNYNDSYQAWGSTGYSAGVSLREVRLGALVLRNVPADVAQESGRDETSLLGANILRILNFQIRPGSCVATMPAQARSQLNS